MLLNASLAFQNIWPTPAIIWHGELSIEFAVVLLAMIAAQRWLGPPTRRAVRILAVIWILLVVGHYADVTTPALYGREINLYFDLRFMPDVVAMVVRAAPVWLIATALIAIALIVSALYLAFRWALGRVGRAMNDAPARLAVGLFAALVLAFYTVQHVSERFANEPLVTFATPVTETYARQARLVVNARAGNSTLPPSPSMDADLGRIAGADLFLIFIEARGRLERPDIAPNLAASRAALDAAIAPAGGVVSAFVSRDVRRFLQRSSA